MNWDRAIEVLEELEVLIGHRSAAVLELGNTAGPKGSWAYLWRVPDGTEWHAPGCVFPVDSEDDLKLLAKPLSTLEE